MSAKILVVDDLDPARQALVQELTDAGFQTVEAESGDTGWAQFNRHQPDLIISDVSMDGGTGMDLLNRVRSQSDIPIVLFTAFGSVRSAANAFRNGADDFIASNESSIEQLVDAVNRAIGSGQPREQEDEHALPFRGKSEPIRKLRERAAGLAPLRNPVLVVGPRGGGRDFTVETLHGLGSSGHGTLVKIPAERAESRMTIPDCSAIYLDGIERFPEHVQSYWLRYIQTCEERGFDGTPRIFASSLGGPESGEGAASPLFARMHRYAVTLPELRAIAADIPEIADALVAASCRRVGRRARLSPAARRFLATQNFPGNIAQLEETLSRCIAFTRSRVIRRDVVADVVEEMGESLSRIRERHAVLERDELLEAIHASGGNISQAARRLGRSRGAVYRLIQKHDIALQS